MRKCIPNRELDELGDGLVRSFLKKSGIRRLPKCVDIEGLANSLGLTVIFEEFAEDDYDKIGFLADGKTPLKIKRAGKIVSFLFPLGTIVADSRLRRDSESGKFRFTIAHEVAHHIMDKHNPSPQFQRTFDAERSYSLEEMRRQFNLVEMQADKLAASLLMPPFVINAALKDFNNGNKICMEKMYTRKEAATLLGISITTLDQARSAGQITYVQYVDNGCVYFTEAAIQEYVARCTRRAKPVSENQMTYRKRRK